MKTLKILSISVIAAIANSASALPKIIQKPNPKVPAQVKTPPRKPAQRKAPPVSRPTAPAPAPATQETVAIQSFSAEKEAISGEIKTGLSPHFVYTFTIDGTKNSPTASSECKDEDKSKITALQTKKITGTLQFLPKGKLPGVVGLTSPFSTEAGNGVVLKAGENETQAAIVALGKIGEDAAGTESFAELRATITGIEARGDEANDYSKVSLVKPRIYYYVNVDKEDARNGCKITVDLGETGTIKITAKPRGITTAPAPVVVTNEGTSTTTAPDATSSAPTSTGETTAPTAPTAGDTEGTQPPAAPDAGKTKTENKAATAAPTAPVAAAPTAPKKPGSSVFGCSVGNDPSWMLIALAALVGLRRRRKA